MDASITKVLQAVQEEFPPTRKPRRQSSNHSNASGSSRSSSMDIPIADDNSLPTSSELHLYSQQSPGSNDGSSFALSTSPASSTETPFSDGQQTPRAERTAPLSDGANAASKYIPERQDVSSSSAMPDSASSASSIFKPSNINTKLASSSNAASVPHQRSPKTKSAPSFISLPPMSSSSSNNPSSSGFKLTTHKNEGLMLTPGGDDIPFVFKKRPNMQERRPSREIFA